MHLNIIMRAEGDSFRLTVENRELTQDAVGEMHPLIAQIISATSKEAVVNALYAFRKEAKNQGVSNNYWSSIQYLLQSDNTEDIEVTLLHENAYSYDGHAAHPGALHSESIEKMIAFAKGTDRTPAKECRIF